ncbi:MAG TPA: PIG-L family deacetylase [Pyrinomonadaceae bacterium]|nr:PIG-L family deacetylase [Pyrinomonadaceae bacterium]
MRRIVAILFSCVVIWTGLGHAQVRPVNDYGAMGLAQLLKRLNTTASVMMIGAHPDDEDSALVAYLARGENARTAYLSLTRGDGGQNIIGPELFESLGVIRTEELLQARRLDGAEQYFARAFDYGFSKTLDEAKSKWDEKVILCDVVRGIRTFRPLVVISRFSGTPADGHGQHQYAGYISPLAVKAAADPRQCTQAGEPWRVLKFYAGQGFSAGATATLRLNTGAYDAVLGRSYFEIAMEGRSQHKSQGEGRLELKGDLFSGLNLKESSVSGNAPEVSPFSGIDISIAGIPAITNNSEEPVKKKAVELQAKIEALTAKYQPLGRSAILSDLVAAYKLAVECEWSTRQPRTKAVFRVVEGNLAAAIANVAGIQIDVLADRETAVPGESIFSTVNVFFPKSAAITIKDISLTKPVGWEVANAIAPNETAQGFNRREAANQSAYFNVKVSADARPTQPYWLEGPREGDLFRWAANDDQNQPFSPADIAAKVTVDIDGTAIPFERPIQFRYADSTRGEIRRDLNVVPALSVSADHKLLVVPQSSKPQTRTLTVGITNNSAKAIAGVAGLNITTPDEWKVTAANRTFNLKKKGEQTTVAFEITIPAKTNSGSYNIVANASVGEGLATQTINTIAYPHIQTHRFYTRAETEVEVLDLKVAPVKVGYIMGSGDEVPEAIRQMGGDVTMLEEKDLASGDLTKFDSIVVGVRASETRPDLLANNQRLLDYVKNGGNVIMQYQRGNWTGLAPYPVTIADTQKTAAGSIARVVDENAKVTILEPNHSVFTTPNKITDDDFKGWVQERNAYNLVTFDPQYTPLLESHDAGELENKGGLVIAKVGKGTWTYCSYSFFRQLPAGVPGAYRLFANLLSMLRG